MVSLVCAETKLRVSSVLNRDVKQFGKKYMFDDDEETCWNSDQGNPQWCQIEFPQHVNIEEIHIKFQGGFVGKDCCMEDLSSGEPTKMFSFYPEDDNSQQFFKLSTTNSVNKVKLVFCSSTDFFGRITIYKMDLIGEKL